MIEHRRVSERHGRGRPRIALNLTAMIDVVFLLLIYFIVATKFSANEEVFRLDLPDRQAAQRNVDPFELDEEPLRIQVASGQLLAFDSYTLRVEGPYPQPESFDALYDFLQSRRIDEGRFGGLFPENHPIIIEPTSSTRWEHAIAAFNAAARAGYSNMILGKPR